MNGFSFQHNSMHGLPDFRPAAYLRLRKRPQPITPAVSSSKEDGSGTETTRIVLIMPAVAGPATTVIIVMFPASGTTLSQMSQFPGIKPSVSLFQDVATGEPRKVRSAKDPPTVKVFS